MRIEKKNSDSERRILIGMIVDPIVLGRISSKWQYRMFKSKWANSPPPPPIVPIDHEAIVILIGAISGLYIETGKTIPDNLANLNSRYVKEIEP